MDNKITKSRLSNLMAYEWIIIAIVTAVIIVAVDLLYVVTGVRLNEGQKFIYFYDENVSSLYDESLYNMLTKDPPENTFSFDVLEVAYEKLTKNYNLLSTRLTAHEGDAIVTDTVKIVYEGYGKYCRAHTLIDNYRITPIYSFEDMLSDAEDYLANFYTGDELNESAVKANFQKRMKGDNRFRSETDKNAGVKLEIERIKKLKETAGLLFALLSYDDTLPEEDKIFYSYVRYEQVYMTASETEKETYREVYEKERDEVGARRYGLITNKLSDGVYDAKKYFTKTSDGGSSDVIIMFFDLLDYQPDMQFEELSFLDTVITQFSNLKEVI